jgi:AcrR family transcriptional regulator
VGIEDRGLRDRAERRALIISAARVLAEREGWEAVTTRRLAAEIEYSQTILFKHFASMDDIVAAVVLEAFQQLADVLAAARSSKTDPLAALRSVAHAFRGYATDHPALYDAMFARGSTLPFGVDTTPAPMVAAFRSLREAVAAALGNEDVDTLTEVFWAALHGLTTLEQNHRLRRKLQDQRVDFLVDQFFAAYSEHPQRG